MVFYRRRQMKRLLQIAVASGALALAASAANATEITWNFGTSGYSLATAPSLTATSGPFSATPSGDTATITANGQDALFTSGGFTVGAFAWGQNNNTEDKVTQSN